MHLKCKCFQLTDNVHFSARGLLARFQQACVFGIHRSDNRTVDDAIDARNDSLARNETEPSMNGKNNNNGQLSDETGTTLDNTEDLMCLGQPACSGNGTCQDNECICFDGTSLSSVAAGYKCIGSVQSFV